MKSDTASSRKEDVETQISEKPKTKELNGTLMEKIKSLSVSDKALVLKFIEDLLT